MKTRGFTLIELAICMSILALLLPLVWVFGRTLEAEHRDVVSQASSARELRALTEELRLDLRTRSLKSTTGLVLQGAGSCALVEYALAGEVLERRAGPDCGGTRAVAAPVQSVRRDGALLEVVFAHHSGREPERVTRLLALLPEEQR